MITTLPEQLLEQAELLVGYPNATEAGLRRSVSSAYYALFHLLVREAVKNWKQVGDHSRLARMFDHKQMKAASKAAIGNPREGKLPGSGPEALLSAVATTFVDLQEARHRADYDVETEFKHSEAALYVELARVTFEAWAEVKDEPLAQRYLYSLLFRDRA